MFVGGYALAKKSDAEELRHYRSMSLEASQSRWKGLLLKSLVISGIGAGLVVLFRGKKVGGGGDTPTTNERVQVAGANTTHAASS